MPPPVFAVQSIASPPPSQSDNAPQPVEQTTPAGKGTGSAAIPSADVTADRIATYLERVHDRIQRSLIYPPVIRRYRLTGQVFVRFLILIDGQIDPASIRVVRGDESGPLQAAALETLRTLDRLEPPPAGPMTIEVPVNYQLQP